MAILDDYFEELSSPTRNGRVDINGDCMEDSQISPGEIVVFLHGGRLVKMARASSSVIASNNDLPRHFTIDAESIRIPRRMLRISEFQEILFKEVKERDNMFTFTLNCASDENLMQFIQEDDV